MEGVATGIGVIAPADPGPGRTPAGRAVDAGRAGSGTAEGVGPGIRATLVFVDRQVARLTATAAAAANSRIRLMGR